MAMKGGRRTGSYWFAPTATAVDKIPVTLADGTVVWTDAPEGGGGGGVIARVRIDRGGIGDGDRGQSRIVGDQQVNMDYHRESGNLTGSHQPGVEGYCVGGWRDAPTWRRDGSDEAGVGGQLQDDSRPNRGARAIVRENDRVS